MLPETSDFITCLFICSWRGKFSLSFAYSALHLFQSRSLQCLGTRGGNHHPRLPAHGHLSYATTAPCTVAKPRQQSSRASKVCTMHLANLCSAHKERSLVPPLELRERRAPCLVAAWPSPPGVLGSLWDSCPTCWVQSWHLLCSIVDLVSREGPASSSRRKQKKS